MVKWECLPLTTFEAFSGFVEPTVTTARVMGKAKGQGPSDAAYSARNQTHPLFQIEQVVRNHLLLQRTFLPLIHQVI